MLMKKSWMIRNRPADGNPVDLTDNFANTHFGIRRDTHAIPWVRYVSITGHI